MSISVLPNGEVRLSAPGMVQDTSQDQRYAPTPVPQSRWSRWRSRNTRTRQQGVGVIETRNPSYPPARYSIPPLRDASAAAVEDALTITAEKSATMCAEEMLREIDQVAKHQDTIPSGHQRQHYESSILHD
jgi:hypothetical protein